LTPKLLNHDERCGQVTRVHASSQPVIEATFLTNQISELTRAAVCVRTYVRTWVRTYHVRNTSRGLLRPHSTSPII